MGSIKHVFTNPVADYTGPGSSSIVRPSDWNSEHSYILQDAVSLAGNTAGALANISSGTLILAGGNNITLSQNGNSVTVSAANAAAAPVNFSAGASSDNLGSVVFSNSGGVSFGLSGSTITATVATNYQSQGAYLTTARASNDAIGLNTAKTNVTWTVNSSGLSLDAGAYLTTARASNDAIGLNTAKTNVTWTVNSSGLSLDAGGYAGTGFTTTTVGGAVVAGTHDTAGLKIAVPAYLTTAMLSNAATISNIKVSAGAASANRSDLTFADSNGISFGLSANGVITGTVATNYQSQGAYLTTARASNDAIGLNTAKTNVTWTVNSSGLSLNAAGYAGTGTSATNASITLDSNGLQISVAAPGAAAENNWVNLLGANTAGNTTASGSTLGFSGVNMTLSGTNNSQIVMSVPATSSLVGTNGISISTNGSTISVSAVQFTKSRFNPFMEAVAVAGQHGNGSLHVHPVPDPDHFQMDRMGLDINWSNATNSSGSATISFWAGFYTRNASTLSLLASASSSQGITFAGTGGNNSLQAGGRLFTIGWTTTITKADLWLGIVSRTTSGNTDGSASQYVVSDINSNFSGVFGVASNASNQDRLGLGYYSATTAGIPGSIAFSDLRGTASMAMRPPLYCFLSQTV